MLSKLQSSFTRNTIDVIRKTHLLIEGDVSHVGRIAKLFRVTIAVGKIVIFALWCDVIALRCRPIVDTDVICCRSDGWCNVIRNVGNMIAIHLPCCKHNGMRCHHEAEIEN